jgi:hypothetical protein
VLERNSIGRKDDTALVVGLSDRKGIRKTDTIRRAGAIDQILMTNGRKPSFGGFGLTSALQTVAIGSDLSESRTFCPLPGIAKMAR